MPTNAVSRVFDELAEHPRCRMEPHTLAFDLGLPWRSEDQEEWARLYARCESCEAWHPRVEGEFCPACLAW